MNTLFDVLRHLVEQAGGWASDEAKAAAHKIIADHAALAGEALGELGKLTDSDAADHVASAAPIPAPDGTGSAGTVPSAAAADEAPF